MSWLSVFCSIAADELADRGGDAYRADDEHDERARDEFGAQREPVETVEEEFGEGLVLGFECGGFRRGACGGNGESVVPGTAVAAIVTVIAVDATGAGDERFREHRLDVIGNGLVDGTVTRHERIARMEPRLGFVKLCGLHGPRVHGTHRLHPHRPGACASCGSSQRFWAASSVAVSTASPADSAAPVTASTTPTTAPATASFRASSVEPSVKPPVSALVPVKVSAVFSAA